MPLTNWSANNPPLAPFHDSVPAWQLGKQFFVTDNQVRFIFANQTSDSLALAGKFLTYDGYELGSMLDNRDCLNLKFKSSEGATYIYRTDKTIEQFSSSFTIPLLIDMDLVSDVDRQLKGKLLYIKTPLLYDVADEQMMRTRQFISVRIDSVAPGNKVLPLKVYFTALDTGDKAFLWMSDPNATMHNRDFDSMFSLRDIHENYPDISQATWQHIVRGDLVVGMTKDECRLSLGVPKRISRQPDQTGLREYWYYDGGCYLFFVDGLLNQYRK